jgi:hypothetical protein
MLVVRQRDGGAPAFCDGFRDGNRDTTPYGLTLRQVLGDTRVRRPTSRTAVEQTCVLVCGIVKVTAWRKKSPPFGTVIGALDATMPF